MKRQFWEDQGKDKLDQIFIIIERVVRSQRSSTNGGEDYENETIMNINHLRILAKVFFVILIIWFLKATMNNEEKH